jgi:hypothetical protein
VLSSSVPVKTPQGQAELSHRTLRLSQRHRTVLLLVDGRRSLAQVLNMAQQAGAPHSCVGDLIGLGLIALTQAASATSGFAATAPGATGQVDLALEIAPAAEDVELTASRTLQPESGFADSVSGPAPAIDSEPCRLHAQGADETLEEARGVLLRAVRAEAPVTGALTLLRLRRASSCADLAVLLDEVEARISKPPRTLAAARTLRRVRELLGVRMDSALSAS